MWYKYEAGIEAEIWFENMLWEKTAISVWGSMIKIICLNIDLTWSTPKVM